MQKRVFTVWNEFSLDWLCVARPTRLWLNSNCLHQVADVRGGHCDIIFLVVKNYGLKIGYKTAHKMKTGHYFFEIFVKSPY